MSASFAELYSQLRDWSQAAEENGWIKARQLEQLTRIETQEADELFSASGQRPLIVAFFGGTGVGKSSLLNRLAGDSIARTGVKRPTSKEVTLYIHRDFEVRELPAELPQDDTVIAYHQDDSRRLVAWLDLPDFDSTESAHRDQVVKWLPYIDWVVYVVSPERYHDDIGWRFLQQRQESHSWLFIINHWDEGRPQQREDFRQRLQAEGFEAPTIITTDCSQADSNDEFGVLEETINNSIRQFGLGFLQSLGGQARIQELSRHASEFQQHLGSEEEWASGHTVWQHTAHERLAKLKHTLMAKSSSVTRPLIIEERAQQGFLRRKAPRIQNVESVIEALITTLGDSAKQDSLEDISLSLMQQLRDQHLPDQAANTVLKQWQSDFPETLTTQLKCSAETALAQPGSRSQRRLHALFKTLMWLLPTAAASWAVYFVVKVFYLGTQGHQAFLSFDFAIHSLLMIGLGSLIPWIIQLQLRPSHAKSLQQGLQKGCREAVALAEQTIEDAFIQLRGESQHQREELAVIQQTIQASVQR